jgi:hypothetical protein
MLSAFQVSQAAGHISASSGCGAPSRKNALHGNKKGADPAGDGQSAEWQRLSHEQQEANKRQKRCRQSRHELSGERRHQDRNKQNNGESQPSEALYKRGQGLDAFGQRANQVFKLVQLRSLRHSKSWASARLTRLRQKARPDNRQITTNWHRARHVRAGETEPWQQWHQKLNYS